LVDFINIFVYQSNLEIVNAYYVLRNFGEIIKIDLGYVMCTQKD
jgi:hypothetical protein